METGQYVRILAEFITGELSLSELRNLIEERLFELRQDPEMTDGIARLAGTIDEFHQASEIMAKPDGINIDEALKIINNKVKAKDDSDYSFLLFVLLKNLEHSGLIKIISKPERIVKKAMKKHAEKRPYKIAK